MNEFKAPVLVAVFGTLRRGNGNYEYHLKDETYIGTFRTEEKYTMLNYGGFPGLLLGGNHSIICEVFKVKNNDTLVGLDMLEGYNPNPKLAFYHRTVIDTPFGKAWIYYNPNTNRGYEIIISGDWNKFIGIPTVSENELVQ